MAEPPGAAAPAQDVDQVLGRLAEIIAGARELRSPLGYFPALYRQVTLRVKQGIAQGFFDDGPRMARLDTAFANRYLAAHQAFLAGGATSSCWQIAFQETQGNRLIILQDLLIGINAHINFDLGIAAAEVAPGEAIDALHGDFDKINQILGSLLPKVEAVIGRFSPLIGLLDQIGGRDETQALNFSLDAARVDSWNHALILAHLPSIPSPFPRWAADRGTVLKKGFTKGGSLVNLQVRKLRRKTNEPPDDSKPIEPRNRA